MKWFGEFFFEGDFFFGEFFGDLANFFEAAGGVEVFEVFAAEDVDAFGFGFFDEFVDEEAAEALFLVFWEDADCFEHGDFGCHFDDAAETDGSGFLFEEVEMRVVFAARIDAGELGLFLNEWVLGFFGFGEFVVLEFGFVGDLEQAAGEDFFH